MHFAVKAFVSGFDIENAGASAAAVHVHALFGVESAVVFMELFRFFCVLVNPCDVFAFDIVDGTVRNDYVGARLGGINNPGGIFTVGTFVNVVENNRRCDFTGDIRAVEDNCYLRFRVGFRLFAKVNGKLTFDFAADEVIAGFGDGHKGVFCGFSLGMLIAFIAFAVGISAFVGIHIVIIDDFAADFNAVAFFRRFTVNGNAAFGKNDCRCVIIVILGDNLLVFGSFRDLRIITVRRFFRTAGAKA